MTTGSNNNEPLEEHSVEAWITLDTCLFDAARKQIEHYQELKKSRGDVLYRETGYAAAAILLGAQIFDAGANPFQQYLQAVEIRNSYLAHPKLTPRSVTLRGGTVSPLDFEELTLINLDAARKTIGAAREMVQQFYKALRAPPPKWAVD